MKHARSSKALVVSLLAVVFSSVSGACSNEGTVSADQTSKTTYVEMGTFLTDEADSEAWFQIGRDLAQGFDDICGDTFCEGDFSNLEPLDFECSVSSKIGSVRECAWTFAASDELVLADSGEVAASVPFFVCRFDPTGNADQLLAALSGNAGDPLNAELPGLGASIFDILGDCFESPIDAEPLPEPTEGPYQNVTDNLASDDDVEAWYSMVSSVRDDFDQVCGDTFCEGEYTNLTALRLRCSQHEATDELQSCGWAFAGSDSSLKSSGKLRVDSQAYTCTFPVSGTARELADAINDESSGESPLNRPLPGSTGTLFDALAECL